METKQDKTMMTSVERIMDDDYRVREMNEAEYPLLRQFLYEAIFVPDGIPSPPLSIIEVPELQVYVADFGIYPDDRALVAEVAGRVVGAVWVRIMDDYGHVDDETPSLAIALYEAYRGRGIGSVLLKQMLDVLEKSGYAQVSLSVQPANRAVRMYRRAGFEVVGERDGSWLMVRRFCG